MVKTYIPMRMIYPKVSYEFTSGVQQFELKTDVKSRVIVVGAGGFSFATYSGDAASSGRPGWCGKQAITGGCGGLINIETILPKGKYRVEIGVLGGGTDTSITTYSKLKKPSATEGGKALATTVYKDGELWFQAGGGGHYTYGNAGNQKNDGARYTARGSADGGTCIVNSKVNIISGSVIQGAKGSAKASSHTVTNSSKGSYKNWGKPNDIRAWYVEAYSIGYTASGGTGGYMLIETELDDLELGKIIINPYGWLNSKGGYSIIRR